MLKYDYFYNATLKKVVAVFGSIFNDIYVAKKNGALTSTMRVPIAYAPMERYLARINTHDDIDADIALKLPRMSFDLGSIQYDTATKLNRLNRSLQEGPDGDTYRVWQAAPYILTFNLNVFSRGQDEALQVVEQIFPFFNPVYTLTVKGLEGPDSKTDLPITLNSVDFQDDYEGDFQSGRRTLIYTLTFTIPIKFVLPSRSPASLIKSVEAIFSKCDGEPMEAIHVRTKYADATEEDHEVIVELGALPYEEGDPIWDERP